MPDPNLINYIKGQINKGADIQSITKTLLSQGWNQREIDDAFINLQNPAIENKPATTFKQIYLKKRGFSKVLFIIFLLLIIIASFYFAPSISLNPNLITTYIINHFPTLKQNPNHSFVKSLSPAPDLIPAGSQTQTIQSNMTAKANDTKRRNDISQILNALEAYAGDYGGQFPSTIPQAGTPAQEISGNSVNLCSALVPKYIPYLPQDPSRNKGAPITDCSKPYDTGYVISIAPSGNITVKAPYAQLGVIYDTR